MLVVRKTFGWVLGLVPAVVIGAHAIATRPNSLDFEVRAWAGFGDGGP